MDTSQCISSFYCCWTSEMFPEWIIMKTAAVNTFTHIFWWTAAFISIGHIFRRRIAGQGYIYIQFQEILWEISKVVVPVNTWTNNVRLSWLFLILDIKIYGFVTSLAVQWLRICILNAGDMGFNSWMGNENPKSCRAKKKKSLAESIKFKFFIKLFMILKKLKNKFIIFKFEGYMCIK